MSLKKVMYAYSQEYEDYYITMGLIRNLIMCIGKYNHPSLSSHISKLKHFITK